MGGAASTDDSGTKKLEFHELADCDSDGELSEDLDESVPLIDTAEFVDCICSRSLDTYTTEALKGFTKSENSGNCAHSQLLKIFNNVDDTLTSAFASIFGDHLSDKDEMCDVFDIIPSKVLNDPTKETLRVLSNVGSKLQNRFHTSTKKLDHPFTVNLGLLRLYVLHRAKKANVEASKSNPTVHPIAETFLAQVMYYMQFAGDVYSKVNVLSGDKLLDKTKENDKTALKVRLPRHIVMLDHMTKTIVIAIRGTYSVADVLTDAALEAST